MDNEHSVEGQFLNPNEDEWLKFEHSVKGNFVKDKLLENEHLDEAQSGDPIAEDWLEIEHSVEIQLEKHCLEELNEVHLGKQTEEGYQFHEEVFLNDVVFYKLLIFRL